MMTQNLLIIASLLAGALGYFDYSDCEIECRSSNESCTISMINSENFPCDCIKYDASCLNLATRKTVCIRKDLPAVGGEDIWDAYNKYNPKPNPRPMPIPNYILTNWIYGLVAYSLAATALLLAVGGVSLRRFLENRRRREYQPLDDVNRPPDQKIRRYKRCPCNVF